MIDEHLQSLVEALLKLEDKRSRCWDALGDASRKYNFEKATNLRKVLRSLDRIIWGLRVEISILNTRTARAH